MPQHQNERGNELLETVDRHLDRPEARGDALAGAVFLSRYHFQRVFRRTLGEPPGEMRRRLRLERAAFDLRSTQTTVTVIALDAGYQSLAGFSRAFRAAYGLCPSAYRRAANQIRRLPGASGVHYDPGTRRARVTLPGGKRNMDLMDRLIESDYASKRRLLECARLLSDAQLDAPLAFRHNLMPFVEPARTLRESLGFITGSGWVDQMFDASGHAPADTAYRSVAGDTPVAMIERFEGFYQAYRAFVSTVQTQNLWDQEWVDDACEPPETFAIGGVLESQLSWDIAYRQMLERQFEQMGFQLHEINVAETK